MILHLAPKDKELLAFALKVLAEEYTTIADSAISNVLSRGFREDAALAFSLADRVSALREQATDTELRAEVIRLLNANLKINAIKYVREQRPLGLKEAKEYVDGVLATIERQKMRGEAEQY